MGTDSALVMGARWTGSPRITSTTGARLKGSGWTLRRSAVGDASCQIARRRASVRPDQVAGNWSFVALAGLHLLEGMGQGAGERIARTVGGLLGEKAYVGELQQNQQHTNHKSRKKQ